MSPGRMIGTSVVWASRCARARIPDAVNGTSSAESAGPVRLTGMRLSEPLIR